MPSGIQIWDQFGNLKLDLSDRIGRFLGMIFVPAGTSGSVVNEGFLTGTPYCITSMHGTGGATWSGDNLLPPAINFVGNTMFYGAANAPHRLHMWVY